MGENAGTDTFTVVLDAQPSSDVVDHGDIMTPVLLLFPSSSLTLPVQTGTPQDHYCNCELTMEI
ncbi:MAG: hypothetical protein R3A45_03040 [Bdellovibrionota bacterium]